MLTNMMKFILWITDKGGDKWEFRSIFFCLLIQKTSSHLPFGLKKKAKKRYYIKSQDGGPSKEHKA